MTYSASERPFSDSVEDIAQLLNNDSSEDYAPKEPEEDAPRETKLSSEQQFAETLHHLENSEAIRKAYFSQLAKPKRFWHKKQNQQLVHKDITDFGQLAKVFSEKDQPIKLDYAHNDRQAYNNFVLATTGLTALTAVAATSSGTFFSYLKSGETLLKGFFILMAIGSASLPFVAYNMRVGNANLLSSNADAVEAIINQNGSFIDRVRFEPINGDISNSQAKADLSKPITIMPPKDNPQETMAPKEAKPETQKMASLVPTNKAYKVKNVNNGMALIEYDQGYWFASPGSYLPDGSLYLKPKTNIKTGKVELHTSQGVVPVE